MDTPSPVKLRKSLNKGQSSSLDVPFADIDEEKKLHSAVSSAKGGWDVVMSSGPRAIVFWIGVTLANILVFAVLGSFR